ncbi:uncharacterized protein LOC8065308 isoform X2 [Sorghum bicolor]|uniref:uncharacterized protein LOC8065308 isoform X2 n=1 Tax=Sorghum bicolor TaxID=4558 RepID=UPI000B425C5B|nr:uncharacterized protein LOC8065308 isoform X2 [Sorghum bicolor]|eukprot:XP_021304111.1 uncharacterized protein LOC8065308 isoform X2 [Sorghum bicolor]
MATPMSPWKGRLRSHHATPQSLPKRRLPSQTKNPEEKEDLQTLKKPQSLQKRRLPSQTKNREEKEELQTLKKPQSLPKRRLPSQTKNPEEKEELQTLKKQAVLALKVPAQTLKKQAAPKKTERGRQAGAGAQQPRARLRQSARLAGRDPEHPIVIDNDVSREHKAKADQSAITPLRRSQRFLLKDKSLGKSLLPPNHREIFPNRNARNGHRKDKNQESLKRNRGSAALPLMKDISDVSNKKSDKHELNPSHCKVQTRKRKRGTERGVSSKKQSCQEPEPLPAYCQEIAPRNEPRKSTHRRIEKVPFVEVKLKVGDERLANIDENINKPNGTDREGMGSFCGSDDWTKEQDMALRKAYFSARPSPHFWKRVSKMVPGRSAEDCFKRIYSDLSTPTPIGPRRRTSKTTFSPIGNFTLSDPELPNILEPTVGRRKTAKQKSLAAQKAVKHLLQKHCRIDRAQEADHFSVFEGSPSALQLNLSFEDSPGTPDSCMNSASLGKRSGSSSARKTPFSRLSTKPSEPSPAVLKPIKNVILHEKYIDRLARREGTKRPRRRTQAGSKAADSGKSLSEQQAVSVKAAKNALISEATDFISSFKTLQANSLAHIMENSEDEIECDASDCSHDDKE